jgi:hypothetical protein
MKSSQKPLHYIVCLHTNVGQSLSFPPEDGFTGDIVNL